MKRTHVLHIVGAMNRGGVESWLMEVLRHIDRERFQVDFLVHSEAPGAFDNEVRELGSNIYRCPLNRNPFTYLWNFMRILRSHGPFDVVHSHVHYFSGITLLLARAGRVPARISHSHSAPTSDDSVMRRAYTWIMSALVCQNATLKLAGSEESARSLYGRDWKTRSDTAIFYTAIDFSRFFGQRNVHLAREGFHIPIKALVVGHVGRFSTPKNHSFLLDIFSELKQINENACLLLVGDGVLRPEIEQKAAGLGILESIRMIGIRQDVPEILMDVIDVVCFPSLYEGLPIAILEAQAAHVPCIISDRITREVILTPKTVSALPLEVSAAVWARAIHLAYENRVDVDDIQLLSSSMFSIQHSIPKLEAKYDKRCSR
jgi:glycosyltransferase involved in cell wall biosynthesis